MVNKTATIEEPIGNEPYVAPEIRIRSEDIPSDLHPKLERLQGKIMARDGIKPTKPQLIVDLLSTHPKVKSIKL